MFFPIEVRHNPQGKTRCQPQLKPINKKVLKIKNIITLHKKPNKVT